MSALGDLSRELEDLVAHTTPGVVGVEHARGQGSGVVLADDGYVITNSHVVAQAGGDVRVRLATGDRTPARVVGDDPASDLAVLRTDARSLVSLPLADTRRLRVGQLVVAIGDPFRFQRSASLGIVSALDRTLPGPRRRPFEGLVQTDAAINPGNSGGPLLDTEGRVVGINTAVIPHARGIGFAIPAHTVSWVAAMLIKNGRIERPLLGIAASGEELVPALAEEAGQPRAVRVHDVGGDTPAAAAGLRKGDLVLAANANPVFTIDDLQRVMVLSGAPEVSLELLRGGKRVAVAAHPERERRRAA